MEELQDLRKPKVKEEALIAKEEEQIEKEEEPIVKEETNESIVQEPEI